MLNVDAKILATKLKKVISFLVTSDQTAYIPGRFIGENVRLISDVYTDAAQLKGYIFAADMEKLLTQLTVILLLQCLRLKALDLTLFNG